jgi:hypothetical protein
LIGAALGLLPTARHITLVEKFLTAWRIALLPSIPVWGQATSNMSLKRSRKVCTPAQVNARLKRMIHRKALHVYNNGWIVFSVLYQGAASIVRTMRSMFMLAAQRDKFITRFSNWQGRVRSKLTALNLAEPDATY